MARIADWIALNKVAVVSFTVGLIVGGFLGSLGGYLAR